VWHCRLACAAPNAYFERMRDGHLVVGRVPEAGSVQLWSNDYLGLGGHPGIVKAQVDELESQSDGVFMSAVFLNETSLQRQFERQMASYLGAEAAVLCQSGLECQYRPRAGLGRSSHAGLISISSHMPRSGKVRAWRVLRPMPFATTSRLISSV